MQMQILHGLNRTLEKMPSYRCHLARSSKLGRCANMTLTRRTLLTCNCCLVFVYVIEAMSL